MTAAHQIAEKLTEAQAFADSFYWHNGPCCAGCDHWRNMNTLIGECVATAPGLSGDERAAALGMAGFSISLASGHALTRRDHHCGQFADTFDWPTLPLTYLARIGAHLQSKGQTND